MDDLFSDAVRQLLADQCTPQVVRAIESDAASPARQSLWQHIEDAGFADALVSESQGGAGLSLPEAHPLFEQCGAYAMPLPLAETVLARALLAQAGVARPTGSIAFGQALSDADGRVRCDTVHLGRVADWVLARQDQHCLLLPTAKASASPAGFALDATLEWPAADCADAPRVAAAPDLRLLQACTAAAQLAGALMRVFESTLQYANDRQQFGRPIGKFQAIQHQLSVISEHVFAARMAAQIGCQIDHQGDHQNNHQRDSLTPDRLRVAIAKARASEAAVEVAALSHSIHGAIGFTAEFDLQLFTRRLHLWRQTGGSESYWHDVAGAALVEQHDGLTVDLIRRATDVAFA
ncbi:MAG: acyl-CoA/acyl-ACP dehydrogenase [Burkholderiaceae bacterium]|jgi:acyl-CoA dehydrogenase|nr:acyl-CoA/acyl-ACP dehydrogenase [Burkholderiaceae bacterium]